MKRANDARIVLGALDQVAIDEKNTTASKSK
jgi:hypothetical protein